MTHLAAAPVKSRRRRWEYGSILRARECAHAVNMRGSKDSCGMLLIGELASWGSKHTRQLRSDSCCVTGGADEQGPSCVPPLFITADKRLEVYPRQRRLCECLQDAIIGRSCHTTRSLGGAFWNCCFPHFFLTYNLNIKRNLSDHGSGVKLQWTVTYTLLILFSECWPIGTPFRHSPYLEHLKIRPSGSWPPLTPMRHPEWRTPVMAAPQDGVVHKALDGLSKFVVRIQQSSLQVPRNCCRLLVIILFWIVFHDVRKWV